MNRRSSGGECVSHMKMRPILLLTVMLAATSDGLDICDATQEATCNDTLGLPVYLQLMRNTTGRELRFRNGTEGIFTSKSSRTVFHNEFNTTSFRQRWQFVCDNGTLIINPAERRDAGTYRVEIYEESTGKSVGDHTVQLIIEDPPLTLTEPSAGSVSTSATSPDPLLITTGPSVGHMSTSATSPEIVLPVSVSLVAILVGVCVAAGTLYICKKKKTTQTPDCSLVLPGLQTHSKDPRPTQHTEPGVCGEVQYAVVNIMQRSGGQQRGEQQVEYGQVKKPALPGSPVQQVYSVYAQVGPAQGLQSDRALANPTDIH